jgi:type II secretory pathway component GspD/PulD (secretin)
VANGRQRAKPGRHRAGRVGQPSTGGYVQADPATNSLIITAPEPLYRQMRAMIDQLDTRRAQVYIESMIVEVDGRQERPTSASSGRAVLGRRRQPPGWPAPT